MADTSQYNTQTNSKSCSIVILGASYAGSWKIENISGCQIINKGIPGDRTNRMLARFDKDVSPLNPDYVLVWGFINDISNSDKNEFPATKKNIKANLVKILNMIDSIDARPILATEITMGYPPGLKTTLARLKNKLLGRTPYQQLINGHVMDVNRWLIDYADKHRIPLLHLHQTLSDKEGFRKVAYLEDDGSHVTTEGYMALDRYIQSIEGSILHPPEHVNTQ